MSVQRVPLFAFVALTIFSTVALATEAEEPKSADETKLQAAAGFSNRRETIMEIASLLGDFAARSTTYSSLLTLNVANVIILALIAFVALGYFGFLDFGATGRSMANTLSESLQDSELMDSLMQGVGLALEKLQHLDDSQMDQDEQL